MNRQKLSVHTLMCLLACATAACNSDLEQKEIPTQGEGERITVTATAGMPQGQPSTRLGFEETTDGTNQLKITWRPIDDSKGAETFSVLAGTGSTTPSTFTMQSMDASGGATFTGQIISADETTYYAVYPALPAAASLDAFASATTIPLDMTGQTGDVLDESKVYMYGSSSYLPSGTLNFDFQHLTSIVKVTLKFPKTPAEATVSAVTFTATDGLYTKADANITATPATYSNQTTGSLTLSSTFTLSSDANPETTVYLHVLPATLTNFKVTAEVDGMMIYIGTISADTEIEAGKMYTATVEMKPYTLDDAKIGDFYRMGSDKNGYLIPRDANLTDAQKKECIGIVFYVGSKALDEDPLLRDKHRNCSHGLVVALQDAGVDGMNWSKRNESIQKGWVVRKDEYKNDVNLEIMDKMCGYSNTLALMDYNAAKGVGNQLCVLPCDVIKKYSEDKSAPTNSSDWYLPSLLELKYVCRGQGAAEEEITTGMEKLNEQIAKVTGGTLFGSDCYWSSTEWRSGYAKAWNVNFGNSSVLADYKDTSVFRVRPILAF